MSLPKYYALLASLLLAGCASNFCVRDPLMYDDSPTFEVPAIVTLVDCQKNDSAEASLYEDGKQDVFFAVANKKGNIENHEVPMTVSWQDDRRLLFEYDKRLKVIKRQSPKNGIIVISETY